jgi:uncharacterized protein
VSNPIPPRRLTPNRHIAFPLRFDGRGRTALVDDQAYLTGLVEQVLFTSPGERVNRPEFGSGVSALVFAPSGDALAHSTQALVQGALQRWLGDLIRVERVEVTAVDSRLDVLVEYVPLRAVNPDQRRTLRVSGGVPS